jgi:hypothetical protein
MRLLFGGIVAQKDEAGIATRAWPLNFQLLAALGALRRLGSSVHGLEGPVVADGLDVLVLDHRAPQPASALMCATGKPSISASANTAVVLCTFN